MLSAPRVTIGIPVYQGERYLAQALEAACAQTFQDLEICVSDNASTDQTVAICRDWASRDPRIRLEVSDRNRGAAWNFNQVARMARGRYFKWLAVDDLIDPTYIEHCVERLEAPDQPLWVHSRFTAIQASTHPNELEQIRRQAGSGRSMLSAPQLHACRSDASPSQRFRGVLLGPTWIDDNYGLIRREALLRTRLELPLYGSEKILVAELALQGRYAEIPKILSFSRQHDEGSSKLQTAAEQQAFVAPDASQDATPWRLRCGLIRGFWSAISRHPLTMSERLRCHATMFAYATQLRKLPQALRQILTGSAVRSPESPDSFLPMNTTPWEQPKSSR